MVFVLISDTHSMHQKVTVPDGDVLIHAGDLLRRGTLEELAEMNTHLGQLPHAHKIVIAGNRDYCLERDPVESRKLLTLVTYLQDEEIQLDGIRIYGSPWQPPFLNMAFNLPRGEPLREKWSRIPAGIDVLVTHTPPFGIGDRTISGEDAGCADLLEAVHRVHPKLHVFGHIHEGYGIYRKAGTVFVNASVVNVSMQAANPPVVIELYPAASLSGRFRQT